MAEGGGVSSQVDIASLKETLCAQQKLLQSLYGELDVEREASASAASEALSMILRLQGEKATVQMEAEQYKRLAEEKMCHAEEALAIFEDLIFQKEMEIAALDYQVQSYKYKLMSLGCADPGGTTEIKFPEHLLQLNESVMGDAGLQSLSRRNSFPVFPLKLRRSANGRENSPSPEVEFGSKLVDEREQICHEMMMMNEPPHSSSDYVEKKTETYAAGGITSYWEQIRKLDERVKLIAGVGVGVGAGAGPSIHTNFRRETRSPSPFSSLRGSTCDLTRLGGGGGGDMDRSIKYPGSTSENENNTDFPRSPNVLDVFEVPQTDDEIPMPPIRNEGKLTLQQDCNTRLEKPDSLPKDSLNLSEKDKRDLLKRLLAFPPRRQDNNARRFSEGGSTSVLNINFENVHQPTTSSGNAHDSQTHEPLPQPDRPSEIIEAERESSPPPPSSSSSSSSSPSSPNREVELLNLLHEIKAQLNSLHTEVTDLKTNKSSSSEANELSLASLKEAMVYFWL
ncbi:PREDICTED: uncharacterized protein LOC109173234 [Ipomoea nil]|uniref:uncharacterized protein LOC109173234 n=1 Tax=Ipomoea nil TaxID=35883 RepID=UPI0009013557|nr:PREDICTED: uncharacterized protein LOC109173234 [Ipomoea nil]XP_019178091.1 PREDICTED: uncharacterized protein LOC109173234 [Ipomoea nil]